MKQVLLDGRGRVNVVDVPAPALEPGYVLVRTAYSLISSGTETAAIRQQSKGVIERAAARPDLVRRVAKQVLDDGVSAARDAVRERLSRWNVVGYSLAGAVAEIGHGVEGLKSGDRVSCAGAEYAHHAEVAAVPAQLAVRVPEPVGLKAAAFAPVCAVAMQGVRRSGAALGETAVVIGLGLVGLLACRLLYAAGCQVVGVDPNPRRCRVAEQLGCRAAAASYAEVSEQVSGLTAGRGADAVLICAATRSDDPVNRASDLVRERGRVVVVGDVGLSLRREGYYRKELDLFMSRSLGPGRYDRGYEVDGVDYPAAYVRWTERRNVEAGLGLMADGKLDPTPLVSASYRVSEAAAAYEHLAESPDSVAVLLEYGDSEDEGAALRRRVSVGADAPLVGRIGAGLIGPGSFARAVHLPMLRKSGDVALRGIAGRRGPAAHHAAEAFGGAYAVTDPAEIFADPEVQAVWITTPHDSHADLAVRAVESGKHVFVEKPLALTLADCLRVVDAARDGGRLVAVGFNRRFAPASLLVRNHFRPIAGPKVIAYRVRGDETRDSHWIDDPDRGGGRLLGEGCHFLDWMAWFLGEEPVRVYAARQSGGPSGAVATIEFSEGSVGTLVYTTEAAQGVPKERVEVFGGGRGAVLDDFRVVELTAGAGRARRRRAPGKGYEEQFAAFVRSLKGESPPEVTAMDGLRATACALAAMDSLASGDPQIVDPVILDR